MSPAELEKAGIFAEIILRVLRDCTDKEGLDSSHSNAMRLGIPTDAAKAFWLLGEMIREAEFRGLSATGMSSIAGYPVALAEEIQDNPLVRTCSAEWRYEGHEAQHSTLGASPTVSVTEKAWAEARNRLAKGEEVPAHVSFALDAAYFMQGDPVRAVIMACAAWEIALRFYLSNVAAKRDPAYAIAADGIHLPTLCSFAEAARGGRLFYDRTDPGSAEHVKRQREHLERLPRVRNKLIHRGERDIPEGETSDIVLSVLNAIDWLFR